MIPYTYLIGWSKLDRWFNDGTNNFLIKPEFAHKNLMFGRFLRKAA